MFFVRTKRYDALSGVILAVTGCEVSQPSFALISFNLTDPLTVILSQAIFASLGQFTPNSIRLGFVVAYIPLVLAYLGQGE